MSQKTRSNPSSSTRADPSRAGTRSKPAQNSSPGAGFYLVATPIGNLGDITLRALEVLGAADLIACEDTRVTGKLMKAHGIEAPLTAYHEHNAARMRPRLIGAVKGGKAVALVSDAGTPLVSDPGYKLVQSAIAEGLPVTVLPGASAALAALTVSGLPSDRFLFAGFLQGKPSARKRALMELAAVPATLVVFESARRLGATLGHMAEVLGPRPAAVARELTKLYEEVRRDPLDALAAHYGTTGAPKGEVVIVIGPPDQTDVEIGGAELDERLRAALKDASLRDAVAAVTRETGLNRQMVYARALELTEPGRDGEP